MQQQQIASPATWENGNRIQNPKREEKRNHSLKSNDMPQNIIKLCTVNSQEPFSSNFKQSTQSYHHHENGSQIYANPKTYECSKICNNRTISYQESKDYKIKSTQKEGNDSFLNDTYIRAQFTRTSSAAQIFESDLQDHHFTHEIHKSEGYPDLNVININQNLNNMHSVYAYRCEITNPPNPDYCGCESDIMFSAMRSLNECANYKYCGKSCKCMICGDPKSVRYVDLEKKKILCRPKKNIMAMKDLEGKSQEEMSAYLLRHAYAGLPLPDPRNAKERQCIEYVQRKIGLPVKPTDERKKFDYNQAFANGIITYLEGKTSSEKELILIGEAERGLPLPKGRTDSEEELIKKVKMYTPKTKSHCSCTSEARFLVRKNLIKCIKKQDCKKCECMFCSVTANEASGASVTHEVAKYMNIDKQLPTCHIKNLELLAALKYKSYKRREMLLGYRAILGLTLPVGLTNSDREVVRQVRRNVGLTPVPETLTQEEKYNTACDAGLITPLEGKSTCQREKLLRAQAFMGLPLPEPKDFRDKALKKVLTTWVRVNSGRLPKQVKNFYRTIAVRLVPLLEDRTPDEREIIFKLRALLGVPLPDGRTNSDRKLLDKVRHEVGLPPAPKTPEQEELYEKAWAAGIITPLEGKTDNQKAKLIKFQADIGLCLPLGRTPYEVELRRKLSCKKKWCMPNLKSSKICINDENNYARCERRKKLLVCRALLGVPLHSEEMETLRTGDNCHLIKKVRRMVGLTPEPKTDIEKVRYKNAMEAGIITPLEGKTPQQQEVILRAHAEMGLILPEGRIPCEKELVKKIKKEFVGQIPKKEPTHTYKKKGIPSNPYYNIVKLNSEEYRTLVRDCVDMIGIPIPESLPVEPAKSSGTGGSRIPPSFSSETQIIEAAESESENFIQTTQNGSPDVYTETDQTENRQDEASCSTPPQDILIRNVQVTTRKKDRVKREKNIRRLAKAGLPVPKAETSSSRILIEKVRCNLGLPPEPKTPSQKLKYIRAFENGLIVPLDGKSLTEKARLLRNLKLAGVLLPMARTKSENALITAIESEQQVTPVSSSDRSSWHDDQVTEYLTSKSSLTILDDGRIPTDSQSAKLKSSVCNFNTDVALREAKFVINNPCGLNFRIIPSRKDSQILRVKLKPRSRSPEEGDGPARQKIIHEYKDVIRPKSCDRGCGCDKKKIKFKNSYVEINVLSPELYSESKIDAPKMFGETQKIYNLTPISPPKGIKFSLNPAN